MNLFFYIEREEQFLIAEIQNAIGYNRVRPDSAGRFAKFGLRLEFEATMLFPTFGIRAGKHHCSGAFVHAIQPVVCVRNATLAEFFGIPNHLAGLEILTRPAATIGVAVEVTAL